MHAVQTKECPYVVSTAQFNTKKCPSVYDITTREFLSVVRAHTVIGTQVTWYATTLQNMLCSTHSNRHTSHMIRHYIATHAMSRPNKLNISAPDDRAWRALGFDANNVTVIATTRDTFSHTPGFDANNVTVIATTRDTFSHTSAPDDGAWRAPGFDAADARPPASSHWPWAWPAFKALREPVCCISGGFHSLR